MGVGEDFEKFRLKLTRHFAFSGKFGLGPRGRRTISIATEPELKAFPVNRLATNQHSCGEEFQFVRSKVMLMKTVEKANKTHSDAAGCLPLVPHSSPTPIRGLGGFCC